jgi:hypothetical protein
VNKSIWQAALGLFLSATTMGCAPTAADFLTRIPVAPFGASWLLEIKDANGKVVLTKKYVRGGQVQYFELAKTVGTSGNTTYLDSSISKGFSSGQIVLSQIPLFFAAEVTELKADDAVGVAMHISNGRFGNYANKDLLIYPDNTKNAYDQIGCNFSIKNPEDIEFSGFSFIVKIEASQRSINALPSEFTPQGTCTLLKTISTN